MCAGENCARDVDSSLSGHRGACFRPSIDGMGRGVVCPRGIDSKGHHEQVTIFSKSESNLLLCDYSDWLMHLSTCKNATKLCDVDSWAHHK